MLAGTPLFRGNRWPKIWRWSATATVWHVGFRHQRQLCSVHLGVDKEAELVAKRMRRMTDSL
jgi:hypothetical protein